MRTTTEIKAFAYPVRLKDQRSGEQIQDTIVIPKEWLQLCGSEGLNIQDDKHLIFRAYNVRGYEVLEIGKRTALSLTVDLEQLYHDQAALAQQDAATNGEKSE